MPKRSSLRRSWTTTRPFFAKWSVSKPLFCFAGYGKGRVSILLVFTIKKFLTKQHFDCLKMYEHDAFNYTSLVPQWAFEFQTFLVLNWFRWTLREGKWLQWIARPERLERRAKSRGFGQHIKCRRYGYFSRHKRKHTKRFIIYPR